MVRLNMWTLIHACIPPHTNCTHRLVSDIDTNYFVTLTKSLLVQRTSRKSLKLTRFTRPLLATTAERHSQANQAANTRPTSRKKAEISSVVKKRFRPTMSLGWNTLHPVELPASCTVCSRFPACIHLTHCNTSKSHDSPSWALEISTLVYL